MRIVFLLLLILYSSSQVFASSIKKSIAELLAQADFSCMDMRVIGICPKPTRNPPVGFKVKYWQPEVFMETVKMPGDYVISEYGVALNSIDRNLAQRELKLINKNQTLPITSGSSTESLSANHTHFNEVHLYDFPLDAVFDTALCSEMPNVTLGIHYLSETDSISWRKADVEKLLPQSLAAPYIGQQCKNLALGAEGQCMKSWGPLYPRQGFVIAANESTASVVDALRSVSIASNPPPHLVEAMLNFKPNLPIDKVQMVYPNRTACFPIGQDPKLWETQSKDGRYVWIYWHQRECCV